MRGSVLVLCVCLCACDPASVDDAGAPLDASPGDDGGAIDAGTTDGGAADAGATDGGATGDAGAIDAGTADGGATPRGSGTVSVTQAGADHTISGFFIESIPVERLLEGALSPLCTLVVESGGCRVYECPTVTGFEPAGTLTASVNGTELGTVTPGAGNDYLAFGSGRAFVAGDTVRFTATGDVVPAFDVSVSAPAAGTATVPSTIPRSTPLVVTWATGDTPDRTQFALSSTPRVAACIVDGASGSLTVDTTVLGALAATTTATFSVSVFNQASVTAGDWDIVATAAEGVGSGVVSIE